MLRNLKYTGQGTGDNKAMWTKSSRNPHTGSLYVVAKTFNSAHRG